MFRLRTQKWTWILQSVAAEDAERGHLSKLWHEWCIACTSPFEILSFFGHELLTPSSLHLNLELQTEILMIRGKFHGKNMWISMNGNKVWTVFWWIFWSVNLHRFFFSRLVWAFQGQSFLRLKPDWWGVDHHIWDLIFPTPVGMW